MSEKSRYVDAGDVVGDEVLRDSRGRVVDDRSVEAATQDALARTGRRGGLPCRWRGSPPSSGSACHETSTKRSVEQHRLLARPARSGCATPWSRPHARPGEF